MSLSSGGALRLRNIAPVALLASVLCGCPAPVTHYERSADIPAPPDAHCLIEALRELADGRGVSYIVEDIPTGTAHRFSYMRSKFSFTLGFVATKSSETTIRHTGVVANKDAEQLPKVRDSMLSTEVLLRNRCGLGKVLDVAREYCLGKACSTLNLTP